MPLSLSERLAGYHRQGGPLTPARRRRAAHKASLLGAEVEQIWRAQRAMAGQPGELAQMFKTMMDGAAIALTRWQRQVLAALDSIQWQSVLGSAGRRQPGQLELEVARGGLPGAVPRTSASQAEWVRPAGLELTRGPHPGQVIHDEDTFVQTGHGVTGEWHPAGVMDHVSYGGRVENNTAMYSEGGVVLAGGGGGGQGGQVWVDETGPHYGHGDSHAVTESWEYGPDAYHSTDDAFG